MRRPHLNRDQAQLSPGGAQANRTTARFRIANGYPIRAAILRPVLLHLIGRRICFKSFPLSTASQAKRRVPRARFATSLATLIAGSRTGFASHQPLATSRRLSPIGPPVMRIRPKFFALSTSSQSNQHKLHTLDRGRFCTMDSGGLALHESRITSHESRFSVPIATLAIRIPSKSFRIKIQFNSHRHKTVLPRSPLTGLPAVAGQRAPVICRRERR